MRPWAPIVAVTLLAGSAAAENWELRSQSDGIAVYTRPFAGSELESFRGVAELDASLREIVAVLMDVPRYPEWYANTSYAEALESEGIEQGLVYLVLDSPWPVTDRDSVVRWRLAQAPDASITVTLAGEPARRPEHDGRVRVPRLDGAWRLSPLGPGRTRVEYEIATDPGGSLPGWLARQWTLELPRETLGGLREQLSKRPSLGGDPRLAAIREPAPDVAAPPAAAAGAN